MARDPRQFWYALEQRWPGADGVREREIARSVLVLLRHRLGPEEARPITTELPEELKRLWSGPGGSFVERSARPVMELSHNKFMERVQQLAHLPDVGQAAQATAAVFGAVREVLSKDDADQVEDQLPLGLKELWRAEPTFDAVRMGNGSGHAPAARPAFRAPPLDARLHGAGGESGNGNGTRSFWAWLDERLEGPVAATAGAVAGAVLAHLRARLSPELADRVRAALPPDLRSYWAGIAPTLEREEPPERFIGRIAHDLDLTTELHAARHAAAATLGSLRRMLSPELADAVREELPKELRRLWEGP